MNTTDERYAVIDAILTFLLREVYEARLYGWDVVMAFDTTYPDTEEE